MSGVFLIINEVISTLIRFVQGQVPLHKPAKGLSEFYSNRIKYGTDVTREYFIAINKLLIERMPYYKALDIDGKARFVNRLLHIKKSKKFIGLEGLKVTDEMKILISASFAQVTFGLKKYVLKRFQTIKIHPSTFYSKILNAELKGATSEGGTIRLSWNDFVHGYKIADDRYNLGLHEITHALKIDVIKGNDFDDRFAFYFDQWMRISSSAYLNLRKGGASFLRKYGGTNPHEFFAVCVEHFFELPEHFKKELPDVYNHLCVLLNQNPLNSTENYAFTDEFAHSVNKDKDLIPVPKLIRKNYKYHNWHWSYGLYGLGTFIGWPVLMSLLDVTYIDHSEVCVVFFMLVLAGILIQFKSLVSSNAMSLVFFLVYCVVGFGPFASALFFLLNLIPIGSNVEHHEIMNLDARGNAVVLELADGAYAQYPDIRTIRYKEYYEKNGRPLSLKDPEFYELSYNKGVFGYKTFLNKEIVSHLKADPL